MSVYRHKNAPCWQFDFQIDGYRFSGATDIPAGNPKRDAQAYEDGQKSTARELLSEGSGRRPLTLRRACERWWAEHGVHLNDPDLEQRLQWLWAQIGPRTLLAAITDDMVSKMVAARRLDVRRAGRDQDGKQLYRPITARTVNKTTVSLLRRVMRRARDNWGVTIKKEPNWARHTLKEVRRPIRELSIAEERALDLVEDIDFAELREFAVITGLRRGQLLVKKTQVDFDNAELRYIAKGGVPKIVPLSRRAYEILWTRRDQHPEVFFTFKAQRTRKCPKTGRQFIRGTRYPITYYGMGSNKRKWAKKAGVTARIHDLRHTTGSRVTRRTGNLKVTQLLLGHSDIATTARFYANVTLQDVRSAMEATAEAREALEPAAESRKNSRTGGVDGV
jgi:integrase